MKDEILVVSTNVLNGTIELKHGFTNCSTNNLSKGLTNSNSIYDLWKEQRFYIAQDEAEKSIEVEQIMPFIIIRNQFNEYLTLVKKDFFYEKYGIKKTNKNKRSLGTSNHVFKSESEYDDPIFKSAFKIVLEAGVENVKSPLKFKGFIKNYIENSCNHLGMVLLLEQNKKDVPKQDKECYESKWLSENELIDKYGQFDIWSRFIIDYLVDNKL